MTIVSIFITLFSSSFKKNFQLEGSKLYSPKPFYPFIHKLKPSKKQQMKQKLKQKFKFISINKAKLRQPHFH